MAANVERVVHLALSPKAAKMLDQLIELVGRTMDGCPRDYIDDPDGDLVAVFAAIRADIADHNDKPAAKKKATKKRRKK